MADLPQDFLAKSSINEFAKWDGLVYGDYHLFLAQIIGIFVTIIEAICNIAHTGEIGDNQIFAYQISDVIKTGETGYDALQSDN